MIYVLDTHPLVWHLESNPRLPSRVADILSSADAEIVIPSIVLAEIWHLYQRKRIRTSPADIRSRVLSAANCSLYPLDEAVLDLLPTGLEIHDAIVVGTSLVYRDVIQRPTQLITRDQAITDSRLIDILW